MDSPHTSLEKLELKLTFTDTTGRIHILDAIKEGNGDVDTQMLGDNIKLVSHLQGLVNAILRQEYRLV